MNNAASHRQRNATNDARAAKMIADRKGEALNLIQQLQRQIGRIPADGSWGNAGDLGHAIEQLTDLVRGFEGVYGS